MKMEGGDLLKLASSTKTTDTGGLTFGPAWLRQLSSGDTKVALPPSPGLAFQLAKHRYGREEMLAIYESLESKPFFNQAPVNLEKEFEDLFKKELQRPVLMYPPSHEEQKFLSTCVNSQMVLNSYNKTQGGQSGGSGGGGGGGGGGGENRSNNNSGSNINGSSGSSNGRSLRTNSESENGMNRDRTNSLSMSRGGSNSIRGSRGGGGGLNGERGGGGRGERPIGGVGTSGIPGERGSIGDRGGGRGRGRGRGTDSQHPFKSIDEEGRGSGDQSGQINSKSGPLSRKDGTFTKSSYSRSHNSWDDRETSASGGNASSGGGSGGANSINTHSSSIAGKKEYSRGMNEENWRNKAAANAAENETNELKEGSNAEDGGGEQGSKFTENEGPNNNDTNLKNSFSENSNSNSNSTSTTNNSRNWRNALDKPGINQQNSSSSNKEWPSYKSKITNSSNNNSNPPSSSNSDSSRIRNSGNTQDIQKKSSDNRNPEWLDDDDEENFMTFDDSGKFVSIKELRSKKAQPNQPETKQTLANETNKNAISTSAESEKENKQKQKEENSKPLPHQSDTKEKETKASNKDEKNSSQSQLNQPKQSLEQQHAASPTPADLSANENDKKSNTANDLNPNANNLISNKNESNLQQQQLLQSKFQINEETALKLSQLGLNEFTIKNLQNAPLNEQLIIANALQNLTLNQNKNSENLIQPNINQISVKNTDHPEAENWFYLDPQNQIQGAFSSEQMAGWFTAGYFTLNLMVKRGCDDKFLPLGVVSSNWGRIPFTPGPQQPPLIQQQQPQPQPSPIVKQINSQQPIWSKEQIMQQIQLYQLMSQSPIFPQNFNLLRNEIVHQISNNMNMSLLGNILQQLQQLQMQQKAAAASVNTLGQSAVLGIIHELRSQQEALINQFSLTTNANKLGNVVNDPTVVDPAILGASTGPAPTIITNSNKSQSIWGDIPNRISPNNNLTPPTSISPMNNLIAGQVSHLAAMMSGVDSVTAAAIIAQQLQANNGQNSQFQMLNDALIKEKIQALFEQTKKEEERKRKMEEEYQLKLKISEEEKRRALEEMRQKEDEQKRQLEEERVREEMRKELQKKKLEEIIKKQEEEKRKGDELKRLKEEEQKLKHVEKQKQQKQKEELKKLELQQQHQLMQQNEENEKKRQQEQIKQAELIEKQKLKLQQEQLNNLQLPAHANWANSSQNTSQQQQQALQLKAILEQQELELIQQRALLEQQKQAELQANQQNNPGGKWSNLFRGAPPPPSMAPFTSTSPPSNPTANSNTATASSSSSSNPISLASIQAEQTRLESNTTKQGTTMSQKISQTPPKLPQRAVTNEQQKNATTWAAWGNPSAGSNTNIKSVTNDFSIAQSLNGPTPTNAANTKNANINSNANSNAGFWGDINEPKKTSTNGIKTQSNSNTKTSTKPNAKPNAKNQTFPELQNSSSNHSNYNNDASYHHVEKLNKNSKKIASAEESAQHAFLRNMTISDEFMKWCQDQLGYFNVDLHIPTFVNFLREIESCAEIEDYVINYLGDTQQAKDFAQQFFINRESQILQQSNNNDDQRDIEDSNSQFQTKGDTQFSKQRQKKRSKGQRLDNQLLGFTVQPDPNLKNRGDIDPL